jgi:peroxiredoxin
MAEMIRIGEQAPELSIKDQHGDEFHLSDAAGKRVLLSFHPLAWTPPCAAQMSALEAHLDDLRSLDTIAVGISIDSVQSKIAWARSLGIRDTRLLADFWPHGEVATRYGLFREKSGFSERANIVLDEDLTVIFAKIYPIHEVPDLEEVLRFIGHEAPRTGEFTEI